MPELPPIRPPTVSPGSDRKAGGAVVVNASHGGIYAAYLAAKLGVAAAIFNDAGGGRDNAGIAGLDYLEALGVPAAAVGHDTARIGNGSDMMARGVITHANRAAIALGCRGGMTCREAGAALQAARPRGGEPPPTLEAAFLLIAEAPAVWALDSASLVATEHAGTVVDRTHGGLSWKAGYRLKHDVRGVVQRRRDRHRRGRCHPPPALDARGTPPARSPR